MAPAACLQNPSDAENQALKRAPTHPGIAHIEYGDNLSSKLIAERAFQKGDTIAKIEGGAAHATKRYTSIQVGIDEHYEFNSDLVYMNHSCKPSVILNVDQWLVSAAHDINIGDELTFFYPSTEWDMDQPFECWCSASNCIKMVRGAKYLDPSQFPGNYMACHINQLLHERD